MLHPDFDCTYHKFDFVVQSFKFIQLSTTLGIISRRFQPPEICSRNTETSISLTLVNFINLKALSHDPPVDMSVGQSVNYGLKIQIWKRLWTVADILNPCSTCFMRTVADILEVNSHGGWLPNIEVFMEFSHTCLISIYR